MRGSGTKTPVKEFYLNYNIRIIMVYKKKKALINGQYVIKKGFMLNNKR